MPAPRPHDYDASASKAERKDSFGGQYFERWKRGAWIAAISSVLATALVLLGLYFPLDPFQDIGGDPGPRETISMDELRSDSTVNVTSPDSIASPAE
jgi:hypothetical protein